MTSLRSLLVLVLALLGCTRENPAFEGGDELLDESSDKASEGASVGSEGASGSVGETANTSDPTTSTTDPSTTDPSTSESTTDPSTTDPSTSESTTDPSTSESTTDPSESTTEPLTTDGLDAPIAACPQILFVLTCMDCITVECCLEDANSWCFEANNDCHCMLTCLANGTHVDICDNMCTPNANDYATALELHECGKLKCELCQ